MGPVVGGGGDEHMGGRVDGGGGGSLEEQYSCVRAGLGPIYWQLTLYLATFYSMHISTYEHCFAMAYTQILYSEMYCKDVGRDIERCTLVF
jgi:hypothetical protein